MKSFGFIIIAAVILAVGSLPDASSGETKASAPPSVSSQSTPENAAGERLPVNRQENKDIRDIKGPLPPDPQGPLLMILLTVSLMGFLCFDLIKNRWGRRAVSSRSARGAALDALDALKSGPLGAGACFQALSGIIRGYYEGVFHLKATAMTTEEFLGAIREEARFTEEQQERFRVFMARCDSVKFAGYEPTREEREGSFLTAREMIEGSREKFSP